MEPSFKLCIRALYPIKMHDKNSIEFEDVEIIISQYVFHFGRILYNNTLLWWLVTSHSQSSMSIGQLAHKMGLLDF